MPPVQIGEGGQAVVEKLCGPGSNGTTPASVATTRIISEVKRSAAWPLVRTAQTLLRRGGGLMMSWRFVRLLAALLTR